MNDLWSVPKAHIAGNSRIPSSLTSSVVAIMTVTALTLLATGIWLSQQADQARTGIGIGRIGLGVLVFAFVIKKALRV